MAELGPNLSVSDPPDTHYVTAHRAATQAQQEGPVTGAGMCGSFTEGASGPCDNKASDPHCLSGGEDHYAHPGQVSKGVGPLLWGGRGGARVTIVKIQYWPFHLSQKAL